MADFNSLPEEMKVQILESCDNDTLATLCRTNREMHEKALPMLWTDLDFEEDSNQELGVQRRFLMHCDRFARVNPGRWSHLGHLVRTLNLFRLPGINITNDLEDRYGNNNIDFVIWPTKEGDSNVYDVAALFPNLENLSLFVKDWWGFTSLAGSAAELEARLTNLRRVTTGGQVPPEILLALLSKAEQIEHLSLINLVYSPGQDHGPDPVLFLDSLQHRFSSLTYLHLSKLAMLDEDPTIAGLRWGLDIEQERGLLLEWAGLLENVHETLVTLILENRYHTVGCRTYPHEELWEAEDEDAVLRKYGKGASDRYKKILFPAFEDYEWPSLREVTAMGIHLLEGQHSPFERMGPRVSVEILPGSLVNVTDEVTPMNISPPNEMFGND